MMGLANGGENETVNIVDFRNIGFDWLRDTVSVRAPDA